MSTTTATIIAAGQGWDFVLVGAEVYRVRSGWEPDSQGFPMGARWECSQAHWLRFRAVYGWAKDVPKHEGGKLEATYEAAEREKMDAEEQRREQRRDWLEKHRGDEEACR